MSRPTSRTLLTGAVTLIVAATLAACSSGSPSSDAATSPSVAPTPTVTCPSPATTTTASGAEATVRSNNQTRTYNVYLPTGYDGTKPVPVIVDYHGTGGTGVTEESFSGLAAKANARGYLVVAPNALKFGDVAAGWRVPGVSLSPNDVQFTADMLRQVSKTYCVDPSKLYATGFSSGGGMTSYVACAMPIWAAVAPMSAVNLARPCTMQPPVPMITFHGTNDLFVAYNGLPGADSLTSPTAFYNAPVPFVVDQWAKRNGCDPQRIDTPVVPTVTKRTYAGCEPGQDVVLYTIDGTGHAYPGGPRLPAAAAANLGGQSQAVDAAKYLLDFFDSHVRTPAPTIPTTVDDPAIVGGPEDSPEPAPSASNAVPKSAPVPTSPFPTVTVAP